MKFKKLVAAVLAAVSLVLAMAMPVSAESIFDTAKNIDSGKKASKTLKNGDESMVYKITPAQKGTATVKITVKAQNFYFFVYDEDGNDVAYKYKISMGHKNIYHDNMFGWDGNAETFKGTCSFDVKANKTYYVQIKLYATGGGSGKAEASFSYPTGTAEETSLMGVKLKKGETMQLYANDSSAKWSTSKKSVATVSSNGLVKAVKKGKAVITLKCGSKTQKIEIIVE